MPFCHSNIHLYIYTDRAGQLQHALQFRVYRCGIARKSDQETTVRRSQRAACLVLWRMCCNLIQLDQQTKADIRSLKGLPWYVSSRVGSKNNSASLPRKPVWFRSLQQRIHAQQHMVGYSVIGRPCSIPLLCKCQWAADVQLHKGCLVLSCQLEACVAHAPAKYDTV